MSRAWTSPLLAVVAVVLGGCGASDELVPREPARSSGTSHRFDLRPVASGLDRPTWVGAAPGDEGALWVLEQPGRVVRLDGDGSRRVVLDLAKRTKLGAEQGLLGVAFPTDFARSRRFYVHHSGRAGETRVASYDLRGGRAAVADPASRRELLELAQPEENHNGGALAFGPDGRLHLGLGDGGGAFDPRGTGQDAGDLLGAIVAADVGVPTPRWEVVAYGLRNPWRFSFDPALGEIWIADVGQDRTEEVNRVLLEPDEPPKNFGWGAYEATRRLKRHDVGGPGEVVWPAIAYEHGEDGCSVTGGFVYRGARLPELNGRYLHGDFCSGRLWSSRPLPDGRVEDVRRERASAPQVTHVGPDGRGEPVLATAEGRILRAVQPGS